MATTGTITDPVCASGPSGGTTHKYTFDNAGNRKTKTVGSTVTKYGYDTTNQLCWSTAGAFSDHDCGPPSGATTYAHDDNGNRTTGSLTYDAFNRLSSAAGSTLTYLTPGNQELIADGSTTLVNSPLGINRSTAGGTSTHYIRDPQGGLVGERTPTSTRYRMPDALGSTRFLFADNSVNDTYDYDPDGNITTNGSGPDSLIQFAAGHRTNSGLYHYGARHYDPTTARWTQRDPLNQPADIRQANSYSYVGGDPVNSVDPRGTFVEPPITCPGCGLFTDPEGTLDTIGNAFEAVYDVASGAYKLSPAPAKRCYQGAAAGFVLFRNKVGTAAVCIGYAIFGSR